MRERHRAVLSTYLTDNMDLFSRKPISLHASAQLLWQQNRERIDSVCRDSYLVSVFVLAPDNFQTA